jgi:coproporphyrinogen III oxidase
VILERVITERHPDGKIKTYVTLFNGEPVPEGFKYCPGHGTILPIDAFSAYGNKCKECANAVARIHHAKRAQDEEWKKKRNAKQKENGLEKKQAAIDLLGGKCADCHGTFHPAVFDFHHENPDEKEYNLGNIIRRKRNPELVAKELSKCVLLCANCHRIRHFGGGTNEASTTT